MGCAGREMRGFTLIEVMVSVVVSTLIFGVVVSMLMTTMRVWRRCSSQSQTFPPAYAVMTRLDREMRNAYYVSVSPDQQALTLRLPRVDSAGFNLVPFQVGHEVTYYRSNDTGAKGVTGTVLWREDYNAVADRTSYRAIARNVTQLEFRCEGTESGRIFAVYSTAVTTVGEEQATSCASRFTTTVAIRNPTTNL